MSIAKQITAFVSFNQAAFAVFDEVATLIEAKSWHFQLKLASAGILPGEYRPFAIAYVATKSGTMPFEGQRGLTFGKGTSEYSRVEYIVGVLNGAAQAKAEARKAKKEKSPLEKALEAYAALSKADQKAFHKAI